MSLMLATTRVAYKQIPKIESINKILFLEKTESLMVKSYFFSRYRNMRYGISVKRIAISGMNGVVRNK